MSTPCRMCAPWPAGPKTWTSLIFWHQPVEETMMMMTSMPNAWRQVWPNWCYRLIIVIWIDKVQFRCEQKSEWGIKQRPQKWHRLSRRSVTTTERGKGQISKILLGDLSLSVLRFLALPTTTFFARAKIFLWSDRSLGKRAAPSLSTLAPFLFCRAFSHWLSHARRLLPVRENFREILSEKKLRLSFLLINILGEIDQAFARAEGKS